MRLATNRWPPIWTLHSIQVVLQFGLALQVRDGVASGRSGRTRRESALLKEIYGGVGGTHVSRDERVYIVEWPSLTARHKQQEGCSEALEKHSSLVKGSSSEIDSG